MRDPLFRRWLFACLFALSSTSYAGVLIDSSGNLYRTSRVIYSDVKPSYIPGESVYSFYTCSLEDNQCVQMFLGTEEQFCKQVDVYESAVSAVGVVARIGLFTVLPYLSGAELIENVGKVASGVNTARSAPEYVKEINQLIDEGGIPRKDFLVGQIDPEKIDTPDLNWKYKSTILIKKEEDLLKRMVLYDFKDGGSRYRCNSEVANLLRWSAFFNGTIEIEGSSYFFRTGARSVYDAIDYLYTMQWHIIANEKSHLAIDNQEEPDPNRLVVQRVLLDLDKNQTEVLSSKSVGSSFSFRDFLRTVDKPVNPEVGNVNIDGHF
ncbi:MAG: hypothetical protein KDD61_08415 [Bdellovibrionales bacterium]|nr:hypothetical protein [Bdellovibrionales bacterium]